MQNDSFKPQKQWEQTSTGYYIVPIDMLDVKGALKDNDGKPDLKAPGEQIDSLYNASGSAEFRNRADYGLVLVNDDKQRTRKDYHLLKIIVDKVRDDAMGHKGTCHVSFNPLNYRHGMVQTIHQTEQFNTYNILDISPHCWLDQTKEPTLF